MVSASSADKMRLRTGRMRPFILYPFILLSVYPFILPVLSRDADFGSTGSNFRGAGMDITR